MSTPSSEVPDIKPITLYFCFESILLKVHKVMNVVVDYGNSSAKVAIFNHLNLIEKHTFSDPDELKNFLQRSTADHCIVSSVTTDAKQVTQWAVNAKQKFILSHSLPLPITIAYKTPHTLGVDRIAGACGALQLFPGSSSLVIDAGSCITYDFVDASGAYHGGGISPGLMRSEERRVGKECRS